MDEDLVKSFLIQVLGTPYFYFTYDSDLTQTQQRLFTMSDQDKDQVRESSALDFSITF